MKKVFLCIILFFTFLSVSHPAQAHVLVTDNNIGAVMHIEPDDDPIVGQQSSFFFEFKDTQNKFNPQQCDCTFIISENGKQVYSQPLFQHNQNPALDNASVFYTFPQKDVYQIQVVGKPNTPGDFQPFTLVYTIRVARVADQPSSAQPSQNTNFLSFHTLRILPITAVIVLFIAIGMFQKIRNKKKK